MNIFQAAPFLLEKMNRASFSSLIEKGDKKVYGAKPKKVKKVVKKTKKDKKKKKSY
jgi:hypothetical protein